MGRSEPFTLAYADQPQHAHTVYQPSGKKDFPMPRKKGSKAKGSGDWMPAFLAALRTYPVVRVACEQAGISRAEAYRARNRDAEFASAWKDSEDDGLDILEASLHKRARDKDTLAAIFILKHKRPEVYSENVNVNVSGSLTIEEIHQAKKELYAKLAQVEGIVKPGSRRFTSR